MAVPDSQPPGGRGRSSPSGQGVLRTVHLRVSLVSEQTAWSPPGAWSTLRVRSSEPLRKPQSLFFLEHGPHRDHSLISHCAGTKGEKRERKKGRRGSPLGTPECPRGAPPTCSFCLSLRLEARWIQRAKKPGNPRTVGGGVRGEVSRLSLLFPRGPALWAHRPSLQTHQDCCTPWCRWRPPSPRDRPDSSGPCAGTSSPYTWCRSCG